MFSIKNEDFKLKNDSLHNLASCNELDFGLYLRQKGSKETINYKVATSTQSKNKVIQENSLADTNTHMENKMTVDNISSNFLNYLLYYKYVTLADNIILRSASEMLHLKFAHFSFTNKNQL